MTPPDGSPGAMSIRDWRLFRVRPNNSPELRLTAMAWLLARHRRHGFLAGMLGGVNRAPPGREDRWLAESLLVPGMGAARAADIIVNVILPFTYARRALLPAGMMSAAGRWRSTVAMATLPPMPSPGIWRRS